MIWLTWRQHRAEGLMTLGMLVLVGVFLLVTGLGLANAFAQLQANHCLDLTAKGSACTVLYQVYLNQHVFVQYASLLLVLPLLLGALVGAPLLAREVEQHTHLLVWTQSITRLHWLKMKLALVLAAGVVASGALLALLTWWSSPAAQLDGSFARSIYDTSGPVWVATTLLALAIGIFAGALTRRTVVAIFLTMVLFVAIRVPVELLWRPNFQTPVTVTWSMDQQNPPATLSDQDWIVSQGYIDAQGNRFTDLRVVCTEAQTSTQCFQANGVHANYISYQPESRFWTFQWMETGIYMGFAILALVATFWLVQRRMD